MFKSISLALICLASITSFVSCKKDDPAPAALTAVTYKDLNADYAPLVFSSDPAIPPTRPAQKRKYTFFSFSTGQIVANADSASTKWDIGFRSTSIIFNGGTSGPGAAGAQVQKGLFADLITAPATGYTLDNKTTNAFAISSSPLASGATATNQWWFNSGTNTSTVISPIAGQVILVKTADGKYAKLEILNFYKGAPATINNLTDLDRYYTFRYVYQGDGTMKLN